ncbi:MAG: Gfo/Idh/MocA family oxidoreductase, partial [Desulfoferrobacter sp.]
EWDDETASITCRMDNGAIAVVEVSECTNDRKELEIYGQTGFLRVSFYRFDGLEFLPASRFPGDYQTRLSSIARSIRELPKAALLMRRGGGLMASFRAEWQSFIKSIKYNRPVECTLEDGLRASQVTLAALQSTISGKSVKVSQAPQNLSARVEQI